MKRLHLLPLLLAALLLGACATPTTPVVTPDMFSLSPVVTLPPAAEADTATPVANVAGTDAPRPATTATGVEATEIAATTVAAPPPSAAPADWRTLPVIPTVSETARQVYQQGQALGRDPQAFSKVGDCQCATDLFFVNFDWPGYYDLGEYSGLQVTIDWFAGSFKRWGVAIGDGFNAAAVLSPLRANPKQCQPGEHPLSCEFRLHNPSFVIISLEKWWGGDLEKGEQYLRQIIEFSIQSGVVPILGTKADNLEGDHRINQTIARLAQEYDIPLWNFWLAVQPLRDHGVQPTNPQGTPDLFHLTYGNYYDFSVPETGRSGWTVRNLTALQALEAVWQAVSQP